MKLIVDGVFTNEIKDFLLSQVGIIDVEYNAVDYITEFNIKYNEKTNPSIIMKYLILFQNDFSFFLMEFDKENIENYKVLKYTIDDMCCEYCYKGLVMDLFENEHVKSVTSNFDFGKPGYDVEFVIEYDNNYEEKDLINFIKKNC